MNQAKLQVPPRSALETASSASNLNLAVLGSSSCRAPAQCAQHHHRSDCVVHLRLEASSWFKVYMLGAVADLLLISQFCCERDGLGTSDT
jgi:hypothetical protein